MMMKIVFILAALWAVGEAVKLELIRDEFERHGTKIDFYDEEYGNGMSTHVETLDGSCKNLLRRWQGRPQSMDTRGTCGSVCTEKDCKGQCVIVYPGRGEQRLSEIKMSKKIVSVQGCFVEGSQKP